MTATSDLNAMIKTAKSLLPRERDFREGIKLLLEIRGAIYCPEDSKSILSQYGNLFDGLSELDYRAKINKKSRTIAYGIWHSTRIEDMTMNCLVLNQGQVYDRENVQGAIAKGLRSTGNELNAAEILEVTRRMNIPALLNYQRLVWESTNKSISGLSFDDLGRKVNKVQLKQLLDDGSVSTHENASWLIDFWGGKTVAGLLMMPMCRHHVVHINESMEAKSKGKPVAEMDLHEWKRH